MVLWGLLVCLFSQNVQPEATVQVPRSLFHRASQSPALQPSASEPSNSLFVKGRVLVPSEGNEFSHYKATTDSVLHRIWSGEKRPSWSLNYINPKHLYLFLMNCGSISILESAETSFIQEKKLDGIKKTKTKSKQKQTNKTKKKIALGNCPQQTSTRCKSGKND